MIDLHARDCRFNLYLAGTICGVTTNYERLRSTLGNWVDAVPADDTAGRFSLQVSVEFGEAATNEGPHFRGLNHVVVASFGHANVFVFDLLRRHVTAKVAERLACDPEFWNETLLPIALGVLGPTVGVVPMHCACLCLDGQGVLVAGVSGAGKSTLSAALVQAGFSYVSDDWTYISRCADQLLAHGMSAPIKLLPDAIAHYPQLAESPLTTSLNGELAYEVQADSFGGNIFPSCEPRRCFFLERNSQIGSTFAVMSPEQVRLGFQASVERLPDQLEEAIAVRSQIIEQIACLPCWKFRYGGTPQFAAEEILGFVSNQKDAVMA